MTREIIHARTNGNPFFIEEVVQSLVEGGHLAGRRGAYRLARPIEMLQVPASVQAVLSSRIDRLPEREKPVLQTAAVIGKTFGEALLGRVMASVTAIDDVDGFSRRGLFRSFFQHAGDAAHLSLHPGRHDHGFAVAVGCRRAAENHVVAIAESNLFGDRGDRLGYRQALAGKRRLRGLERGRLDQPCVGGNRVTFFDEDDVAGHDLGGRNALPLTASNNIGMRCRHLA
jgi:hypothetical protein